MKGGRGNGTSKECLHSSKHSKSVAFGPWDQEFTTWAAFGLHDKAMSLDLVPAG